MWLDIRNSTSDGFPWLGRGLEFIWEIDRYGIIISIPFVASDELTKLIAKALKGSLRFFQVKIENGTYLSTHAYVRMYV